MYFVFITGNNSSDYVPDESDSEIVRQMDQSNLDLFVKTLGLSKRDAYLASSMLKDFGVLKPGTKITAYRHREQLLSRFFEQDEKAKITYCCNLEGLMAELGFSSDISLDWWLFIDGSIHSLKAILLHKPNELPALPVAFSRTLKESYEVLKVLLEKLKYSNYNWHVCADLKILGLLTGMRKGFTKFCCFLCLWDSRARFEHYERDSWPHRSEWNPGEWSVEHVPLIPIRSLYIPPLHLKLGIVKNFIKSLSANESAIDFLQTRFPTLSKCKVKEGIFNGPDIRKLIRSVEFDSKLNLTELDAWKSVKDVICGFLGKNRDSEYKAMIDKMIQSFKLQNVNMSLKVHLLKSHQDFFASDLGKITDEHGERFHQTIRTIEKRYEGKSDVKLLADFCWFLK
jgi:hypothetical protein